MISMLKNIKPLTLSNIKLSTFISLSALALQVLTAAIFSADSFETVLSKNTISLLITLVALFGVSFLFSIASYSIHLKQSPVSFAKCRPKMENSARTSTVS
jgi:hypothetical protein